jgi:hypothetical protein
VLEPGTASVAGRTEERALASPFRPGGMHVLEGELAGGEDIEVLASLVVLP